MSFLKALVGAALCIINPWAFAADTWVQTSSGQDDSDGEPGMHTEYITPKSVTFIRGNYRTAFVKVSFVPGVSVLGGDVITTTISKVWVNCNDLSWGDESQMYFDKNMIPIMSSTGDFDRTKKIWTLKDMKRLDTDSITYRTAQYICGPGSKGIYIPG
jgi:hypothetical protein